MGRSSPRPVFLDAAGVDASPMAPELAPLRRAHDLLEQGRSVDDAIDDLRHGFGLDFVGAMAAVAACVMLSERGFSVPEEPFARPYV